jgi:acetyl/propionyl-CoA carboxylase alpha subunit
MAVITKLLIANRGEIARRVMRTAHAMGIATVAVFSDADARSPFVDEADEAVHLPGSAPADTYLAGDAVIAAAAATGADAIHPGYGFLSENAAFARACFDAGVTFVGPTPEAIEQMGSKLAAKELMAAAGVPVLPSVVVADPPDALAVGFPLLVKAVYGGGGRGMRVVRSPAELADAVTSARREAEHAFGDGTVFAERFVESPRHVEIQVLGDRHGTVVHLFERDCSIQRRYQKVIEESPSPAVGDALRAELGGAAVAAARAIGYVGAGTVEFVLAPTGEFWFLEVNTRLQVEHPVTEMVTGLDLVRLQLLVAQGDPLPAEAMQARLVGHAIEARLYAEDVPAGFLPASGTISRFRVPPGAGIRVDSGVEDGSVVSPYYDALLAKVIAWEPSRTGAARHLARTLAATEVHGPVTNRELLVRVLRHPEFLAGRTDTGFLDRHDPAALAAPLPSASARRHHALAAALADQAVRRSCAPVQPAIPSGWRNVGRPPQRVRYRDATGEVEVAYRLEGTTVAAEVDGVGVGALDVTAGDDRVAGEFDGVRRHYAVHRAGPSVLVSDADGSSTFADVPLFPSPVVAAAPGSLVAPMPGSIARVNVAVGDLVASGDTLIVLEAMKMEHTVRAPHAGTVVDVRAVAGQQVEAGAVLVVVDGDAEGGER